MKTLFEEEDDYYERIKVGNFQNNNYTEFENKGDKKENLS